MCVVDSVRRAIRARRRCINEFERKARRAGAGRA
jgi:hypothetical protein